MIPPRPFKKKKKNNKRVQIIIFCFSYLSICILRIVKNKVDFEVCYTFKKDEC